MLPAVLFALALAGKALTQSTVTSSRTIARLYLPADNNDNLEASVIEANATATAFVVGFATPSVPPGATPKKKRADGAETTATATATDTAAATTVTSTSTGSGDDDEDDDGGNFTECGFPTPVTVTQGPSTLSFAYQIPGLAQTVECVLSGTKTAICTGTMNGASASETGVTTATLTGSNFPAAIAIPITAGASKISKSYSTSTSTMSMSTGSGAGKGPSTTQGEGAGGSKTNAAPAATTSGGEQARRPLGRGVLLLLVGVVAAGVLFL